MTPSEVAHNEEHYTVDIWRVLADSSAAVEEMLAAADAAEPHWTTPRAPGKWSPSQVVEHMARVYDNSALVLRGKTAQFPRMPFLVRPILRALFFNRVVRTGTFVSGRTFKPFDPVRGPDSPRAARERLTAAHRKYEDACGLCAERGGRVDSTIFGEVGLTDFIRFNALHTRHHVGQMVRDPL